MSIIFDLHIKYLLNVVVVMVDHIHDMLIVDDDDDAHLPLHLNKMHFLLLDDMHDQQY